MADFYDRVLAQLPFATRGEREAIRAELSGHVEDHIADLTAAGWTTEDAQARAVACMGDPEEIGRGLAKEYSLLWLVLSRAVTAAIALLCFSLLLASPLQRLWLAGWNLTARYAPERSDAHSPRREAPISRPMDLRVETRSDILYIYRVDLDPVEGEAAVYLCNYDPDPFGYASSMLLDYVSITNQAGEKETGGRGGGTLGAFYRCLDGIPVQPGDDHLYLNYDLFGDKITLEIPLDWGEDT